MNKPFLRFLPVLLLSAALLGLLLFFRLSRTSASDPVPGDTPAPEAETPDLSLPTETDPETESLPEEAPDPETSPARYAVSGVGVLWDTADRGTEITLLALRDDGFFLASAEDDKFLLEARFVRPSGDTAPEPRTGYAKGNTEIYASPYLTGEPLQVLPVNTRTEILDSFGGISLVSCGGVTGYADDSSLSPSRITASGGGKSKSGGKDGGDITLSSGILLSEAVPVPLSARPPRALTEPPSGEPELPCTGTVLADGTELYLDISQREGALELTELDETECRVRCPGGEGTLPRWAVFTPEEPLPESFLRYAKNKARVYRDYRLCGEYSELKLNTELTVLLEVSPGLYYVRTGSAEGFLNADSASEKKIVYSGGGSSSGSSGGGSSSGSSGGGSWSDPVL